MAIVLEGDGTISGVTTFTTPLDDISFDSARDTRNPRVYGLKMNTTNAESDDLLGTTRRYGIDFLSNGFCIRSTATRVNASGKEYIFAAFAEAPFKYANAD